MLKLPPGLFSVAVRFPPRESWEPRGFRMPAGMCGLRSSVGPSYKSKHTTVKFPKHRSQFYSGGTKKWCREVIGRDLCDITGIPSTWSENIARGCG